MPAVGGKALPGGFYARLGLCGRQQGLQLFLHGQQAPAVFSLEPALAPLAVEMDQGIMSGGPEDRHFGPLPVGAGLDPGSGLVGKPTEPRAATGLEGGQGGERVDGPAIAGQAAAGDRVDWRHPQHRPATQGTAIALEQHQPIPPERPGKQAGQGPGFAPGQGPLQRLK